MRKLLSLVLAALSVPAVAQQQLGAESRQPTTQPKAQLSTEQERLIKAIVGSWIVGAKIEPNELTPGGSAAGTAEIYVGPEGASVGQQYHTTGALGDFAGTMLMWWDEREKGFKDLWCDNMHGCRVSNGLTRWEGDVLKGSQTVEILGRKWDLRQSLTKIQPDSFVYEEEIGPAGGELKHSVTVQYTRRARAPVLQHHRYRPKPR
jgi:hypothetical protein